MKKLHLTAASAAIALSLTVTAPALAEPLSPQDLATLDRVGAPTVYEDEQTVVYSITSTDPDSYERRTGLYYIAPVSGSGTSTKEPKPVADLDDASEHSPQFARNPDMRDELFRKYLYFLSDKSGSEQIWRITNPSATPQQVSDLALDVSGFAVSPDGTKVALWTDIARGNRPENPQPDSAAKDTGRAYDQQFVRHWSSWEVPGEYSRIFVYSIGEDGTIIPDSGVDIMKGLKGDSPTKPFGGGEEIAWSPDSSTIAFTMRVADADEPGSTDTDIYLAAANGKGPTVNITADNDATDTLPAFSHDGNRIAYAAMARPGYESDRLVLTVLDIDKQTRTALTKNWDRSVGSIAWEADGENLVVTAQDVLDHPAFRVNADSGDVTRVTGKGNVSNVVPVDGGYVYTMNSLQSPTDIYTQQIGEEPSNITKANAERLANIDPVSVRRFSFAGANGDTVHGQIIKPESQEAELPMLFLVHGGPQGSFGDSWSTRWNPKVMAAQGYAVVTIDFHGSSGYGQDFMDAINQDWGGKPLTDLKLGLAALPEIDPQIDTKNGCALGASYGGYMMNWISGQWNDGFKCIVNHAGLFDMRSFYYATEELWFPRWDFGGSYEEQRDLYEKWNPANHVANWQTPTLVIHGEKDFRVPYGQSLMAFTVLQEKKIPSRLLVFPDENHWILKGANSVRWHQEVFDWVDRWLKPEATSE
ncbi:S9 family peptidase [Alterisphingorhabdus coralli]|uniref:S9 family peptidase n=1 Tax=Alterisphingorhabdus coralli TaxID=3071408 RepID=A0AA97F7Y2_9SPHN|nr:S9 family peptidase [Parasphingorhabdus sp. SCSIO 66989]WOE75586.1 S9 family peptidase [Parasphingorhabdus sp. SCSIO 66989]